MGVMKMIKYLLTKHSISKLIKKYGCSVLNIVEINSNEVVIISTSYNGEKDFNFKLDIIRNGKLLKFSYNPTMDCLVLPDRLWIGKIHLYDNEINRGYGSLLVNELIIFAKKKNYNRISGCMSPGDSDEHESRLRHFYSKWGSVFNEYQFTIELI